MKILELGEGVYEYYTKNVKGNGRTSLDQTRRKLTRNTMVAKVLESDGTGSGHKTHYLYGCLEIIVIDNVVVWLKNNKGGRPEWFNDYINTELYNQLTDLLEITC